MNIYIHKYEAVILWTLRLEIPATHTVYIREYRTGVRSNYGSGLKLLDLKTLPARNASPSTAWTNGRGNHLACPFMAGAEK